MKDHEFDQIYAIMKASFPANEFRNYRGQKLLLQDPAYRLLIHRNDNQQITAFLAAWEFESLRFVEHIAVDPAGRGSGIGGKLMTTYMKESQKPLILEVELPDTPLSQRRILFYERLGFYINPYDYVQPALSGQAAIPLKIMSYPKPLTPKQFANVKSVLYSKVYKVAD